MLRIALVEDHEPTLEQLHAFLNRYGAEHGLSIEASLFRDGSEILECYHPVYDIIFLDIDMPKLNGMSAAEQIRAKDSEVVLVFITNLVQYAIKGYSVQALDYVLKPVDYHVFSAKLERALDLISKRISGQVVLKLPDGAVRLDTRQIYYVEVQNGILHYVTRQGEFSMRGTLQSAEEELLQYHFARCNYWYLVNLRHVEKVTKDTVIVAGTKLQISRRNKNAFMTALTEYVGGGG